MKAIFLSLIVVFLIQISAPENRALAQATADSPGPQPTKHHLLIDPLIMVSLQEARNVATNLELFPEWDFTKTPVLLYRPGVQDILINYPRKPEGYQLFNGDHPLGDETIYFRNDSTHFDLDDQNTTTEIDGVRVLVVSDKFSSMRNQIRGVAMNYEKEFVGNWLDEWNFMRDPYGEIRTILHEGFHVYQEERSDKGADESTVAAYPLLSAENNAYHIVEGRILVDALLSRDRAKIQDGLHMVAAVRYERQSLMDSTSVAYENRVEFSEGLAFYVEYKFLENGASLEPVPNMAFQSGFEGYGDHMEELFERDLEQAKTRIDGNMMTGSSKFGAGPLRFKLYPLGAMLALLLDGVKSDWKKSIFEPDVFLSELVQKAANQSPEERRQYLVQAKNRYDHDSALAVKKIFEKEGRAAAVAKLASILDTDQTLVKISFGNVADDLAGMGYTPFGVVPIEAGAAVYEMVPVAAVFNRDVRLSMLAAIPVYVNENTNAIYFAVSTPVDSIPSGSQNEIVTDTFRLSSAPMDVRKHGNRVEIVLK